MKTLMYTTAIVSMTALGAVAQSSGYGDGTAAQTTAQTAAQTQAGQMVPAFRASEFIGMDLHTLDSDAVRELHGGTMQHAGEPNAGRDDRSLRWTSDETFLAERDAWENVGSINDVILTQDGRIRGILVDVGGFLGFMAHTVMVDLDQIYFVANEDAAEAEDLDDFFVVAAVSREQLEELPEWDDSTLETGFEYQATAPQMPEAAGEADEQTAAAEGETMTGSPQSPAEAPEGYVAIDSAPTADMLIGADVHDAHGETIGQVEDVVIGSDDTVTHLVLDIGGFLGIGSHTVALEMDEAQFYHNADDESLRVHVPMTQEQLETLPEYQS